MSKEIYKVWKETYSTRWGHVRWEVSDQGRVKRNGELYECRLRNGYKVFGRSDVVHRAVAELFILNPENKPCVDHINTNPLDNRAINLRWATYKENANNSLTRKHNSEAQNREETKKKRSESMKELMKDKYKNGYVNPMYGKIGANANKHRVYHDDGTYHYEKKSQYN